MLTQLQLRRFKKFRALDVHLKPFTVLMGENSSGKTTVLQATNLALSSLRRHDFVRLSDGLAQKVTVRKKGVGLTELHGLALSDFRELYYGKAFSPKKDFPGGCTVELIDDGGNVYRLRITSLFGGFNIKCDSSPDELSNGPTLHQKYPLFISGFVGLLPREERLFRVAMQERLRLGQVSAVLRNLLLDTMEHEPDRYKLLVARMQNDFDFHLDELDFNEESDVYRSTTLFPMDEPTG
jgi:AAA ATPase domain